MIPLIYPSTLPIAPWMAKGIPTQVGDVLILHTTQSFASFLNIKARTLGLRSEVYESILRYSRRPVQETGAYQRSGRASDLRAVRVLGERIDQQCAHRRSGLPRPGSIVDPIQTSSAYLGIISRFDPPIVSLAISGP